MSRFWGNPKTGPPIRSAPDSLESRDARTALPQNCSLPRYETQAGWGIPLSRVALARKSHLSKGRILLASATNQLGTDRFLPGSGSGHFKERRSDWPPSEPLGLKHACVGKQPRFGSSSLNLEVEGELLLVCTKLRTLTSSCSGNVLLSH